MSKIRILIADDHEVVRRGLALVLKLEADFLVVGEADNGETAVSLAQTVQPHVALLDWKMPKLDGIQTAYAIKKSQPHIYTLILSGAPVETAVLDALDHAIDGFVHKDISPAALSQAIRIVASGKRYLGHEITQALIARSQQSQPTQPAPTLSNREMQILNLMATPATYKEMGEQLFISEETVRTYAKRIFTKLGQTNRTQAVIAALRLNLISLD